MKPKPKLKRRSKLHKPKKHLANIITLLKRIKKELPNG